MSKLLIRKFISIILIIFILCTPALGAPEGFTEVPLQIQSTFPDLLSFPKAFFDNLKPYYFIIQTGESEYKITVSDSELKIDSSYQLQYRGYTNYYTNDNGNSWQGSWGVTTYEMKLYIPSEWCLSPRLPVDMPYFTNHDIYYGSHLTPVFETAGFDLELPSTDLFYTGDLFDGLMNGFLFDLFDFGNLFALFGDALLTGIYSVGKTLLSALGLDLDRILSGIVGAVTAVREIIVNSPTAFTGAFLPILQPLFDPIFDFFSSLFTRIDSIISSLETITLSDLLTGAVGGITSFDPVQDILEYLFIPKIDHFSAIETKIKSAFPIVDQLDDLYINIFQFAGSSEPKFSFTIYGATVSLIDFTMFKQYQVYIHGLIIAMSYYYFVKRLYKRIPSLIGGI